MTFANIPSAETINANSPVPNFKRFVFTLCGTKISDLAVTDG
jgi:hypothetical protein